MSSSTMSGRSSRAAAIAEAPSAASPTTSKPSASSSWRAQARKPLWSSTIRTVLPIPRDCARGAAADSTASRTVVRDVCVRTQNVRLSALADASCPHWKRPRRWRACSSCRKPPQQKGNRDVGEQKPRRSRRTLERHHRKTAIWGWLGFVIALVVIGSAVGTKTAEQDEGGPGESGRADETLNDAFPKGSDESVLVQSGRYTAGDPQFRAAVRDAMAAVDAQPHVREVESPYRSGDISDDRHAALVNFEIAGKTSDAQDRVDPVTVRGGQGRRPARRRSRRAVRRGERGQGAVRPLRGGLPEGRGGCRCR